jgi:hypothetical protein
MEEEEVVLDMVQVHGKMAAMDTKDLQHFVTLVQHHEALVAVLVK